jgi:hypothetical protein
VYFIFMQAHCTVLIIKLFYTYLACNHITWRRVLRIETCCGSSSNKEGFLLFFNGLSNVDVCVRVLNEGNSHYELVSCFLWLIHNEKS